MADTEEWIDNRFEERFETAVFAADAAGRQARVRFRTEMSVEYKADSTPVTEADLAADKAARDVIRGRFPEDAYLSEEGGLDGVGDRLWVVDPIDGTRSFVGGNPLFSSLVGYVESREPLIGAASVPFLNELWSGGRGFGAWRDNLPCRSSGCVNLSDAKMRLTSPEYFVDERQHLEALSAKVGQVDYGGDAYVFLTLAAGWTDLVLETGLAVHDITALVPIIEAAGGIITDWEGRAVTPDRYQQVLAAGTPRLHEQALNVLAKVST